MRESTASATILKVVLAFTIIFSAFLSLAIVYNRAFRLKNGSLAIIEKYEGNVEKSVQIINNFLKNSGYKTKGRCQGDFGVESLDDTSLSTNSNTKYYYCISQTCSSSCIYTIKLFFKFELPFIGDIFTYKITGKTKNINYYNINQLLS